MRPDDPRHASRAGYDAHRGDGEEACQACLDAAARYQRGLDWDHLNGRTRRIDPTGTVRRLRALVALGWTIPQLGEWMRMHPENVRRLLRCPPAYVRRPTAELATEVFERWAMTVPPDDPYSRRARNHARRKGWLPPLAWDDDIDDPEATPAGAYRKKRRHPGDVDPAVVRRLLACERVESTRAEKFEAMRRWVADGRPALLLEEVHGWHKGRYTPRKDDAA